MKKEKTAVEVFIQRKNGNNILNPRGGKNSANEYRIFDCRMDFFIQSDGEYDRCAAGCDRLYPDFKGTF